MIASFEFFPLVIKLMTLNKTFVFKCMCACLLVPVSSCFLVSHILLLLLLHSVPLNKQITENSSDSIGSFSFIQMNMQKIYIDERKRKER